MEIIWIDNAKELERFCDAVRSGDVVALDTESDHFFRYRPIVALIQLATTETAALIDPLALETEGLEPFFDLVEDRRVEKILHSCRNDIGELDRDFGIRPENIFDTQIAAQFLGYRQGLDNLVDVVVGAKISKNFGRYDWSRRPVPKDARAYAAGDVIHLFPIREQLMDELDAAGRLEAFEQQCAYVASQSGYEPSAFDPEKWRKIKAGKNLDGRGRAALRHLYLWRHELCERLNRAPLHVFDNQAMVTVADDRPCTLSDLRSIRGVSERLVQKNGEAILRIVEQSLDAEIPPDRPPRTENGQRRSEAETIRVEQLREIRALLADELELPLDLILSPAALISVADANPKQLEDLVAIDGVLPWQVEHYGKRLIRRT